MRRAAAVWLVLTAVYAGTILVPASGGERFAGPELGHLRAAAALGHEGRLDAETAAHGVGFPALLAPAHVLAGDTGVQLLLATLGALAFALAVPLARRVVPEPWATAAVLVLALSPPALAHAARVHPDPAAAAALVAAMLLALRVRDGGGPRVAYTAACALAVLPWLNAWYVVPGAVLAVALTRWTARRGRRLAAVVTAEIVAASLVAYATVNAALYDALVPPAADPATAGAPGHAQRLPRLAVLWLDRDVGLLRWAPFVGLAVVGAGLLLRSRAGRIVRVLPERADAEAAAGVALVVWLATLLVAVLAAPAPFAGGVGAQHVLLGLPAAATLGAWGLRWAPRAGAVLALVTLGATVWTVVDLARGAAAGWLAPATRAPLGPALELLPRLEPASAWAAVATLALVAGLAGLGVVEWRRRTRFDPVSEPGAGATPPT